MKMILSKLILNPGTDREFLDRQVVLSCDTDNVERVKFLAEQDAKSYLREEWDFRLCRMHTGEWYDVGTGMWCTGMHDHNLYAQVMIEEIKVINV